jgi:ribonuclease HI
VSLAEESNEGWWHMDFDGATSKEGVVAGVWIGSPVGEPKLLSYKLHFKCTNNMVEYEALTLGLKALKDLQSQRINIQGDSELIIKKVQGGYQTKNPRLRLYRNLVLDLVEGFKECKFTVIPWKENAEVDSLAVLASLSQVPKNPKEKYQIEVRQKPSIPDNVDHWKVFEDGE